MTRSRRSAARTRVLGHLAVALLLIGTAPTPLLSLPPGAPAPARPDVVLIVVDDLSPVLGVYGDRHARTPHIDALARRGVTFTRAYAQYPLCSPSRASFLSGRRPETTRVFDNFTSPRAALSTATFLPEHFRSQGYFTIRVGKMMHNRYEHEIGWHISESTYSGVPEGLPPDQVEAYVTRREVTDGPDADESDGHAARRLATLASRAGQGPLLLALGLHRPHVPLTVPRRYVRDTRPVPLPAIADSLLALIPPHARPITPFARLAPADQQALVTAHYAAVSFVDAQIGVLLARLDRLGRLDRTLVVLIGDHGYHLGDHGGLWEKHTLFERSARVPLIVAGPGVPRGQTSAGLVELVDLYPTLAELAGVPPPADVEGVSFAPLLREPSRAWKRAAFTERRPSAGRSMRTPRYRYTEWGVDGSQELYDHDIDPGETRNLAADPATAALREALSAQLQRGWRGALPEARP